MIDALPEIVIPDGLPAWLISGHEGTDDPAYARVDIATGHNRLRRVYRRPPIKRKVSMMLTEVETLQFESWFERDLLVGQRLFSARLRDMGPGHLWYAAQFVAPYEAAYQFWAEAPGKAHWLITAELVLYGIGDEFGPELTPFKSDILIALNGRGTGVTPVYLGSSTVVALEGISANRTFQSGVQVALEGTVAANGSTLFYNAIDVALSARATPTRTTLFASQIEVALL